jgi:hypothetical protein
MATSQANPAFSSTGPANPANPITTGESAPKEKLSFAERHRAPTTKDVETNRWVFGAQQAVSGPGDRSADHEGTDLGGIGMAGDGGNMMGGTAAGDGRGMRVESEGTAQSTREENARAETRDAGEGGAAAGGQEKYLDERAGREGRGTVAGEGDGTYVLNERNLAGGEDSYVGGGGTTGSEGTTSGPGPRDDGVTGAKEEEDGAGGKKKMNPLKKVVQALKNI